MSVAELIYCAEQVLPLIHGYGPDDDFQRRVKVVADSQAEGVWVNRYGYLGDPKLESIRMLLGSGSGGPAVDRAGAPKL